MIYFRESITALFLLATLRLGEGFSPFGMSNNRSSSRGEKQVCDTMSDQKYISNVMKTSATAAAAIVASVILSTSPVYADEFGRETEAPTLFTGETVLICTKRGPLGACLQTEQRTEENDNDKSDKYFTQPTALVKRKDDEARMIESNDGNALIQRLKQQTEENREKNELLVQQKTFMNDASASFGPFDSQVLILNEDGKGFTLLQNPQAMRLKKAGFIKDKKFIKQPTQQEIDDALESDSTGFLDGIFGSK